MAKKLPILLIGIMLILAGAYFLTLKGHTQPGAPSHTGSSTPNTELPSFDAACFVHPDESASRCEAAKLTAVLESRAAIPQYQTYSDTTSGISFVYPSSIAEIHKT